MSAESPRHARLGGPLTVPAQPPSDRSIIDAVSGFINDVTLSSSSTVDPKDVIQWARFETADINEPTPEGDGDSDISPLLLILGYGSGVQVWLIPPTGEAQEVLSWRQGTVRVLRILPTPQHGDCFVSKRPLIALCDSASPGPTFCSLSFISIRGGEQVKSIKFKNPILDVLANKRSVVVSFSERFAVFDAATLEDRICITTCFPCPCPLGGSMPVNPLALGDRWLAYADKKLNQSKRSSGGCEGEGVTSYTATVLHAAKSLSKGLRGLGESVAHSLAGGRSTSQSPSPPNADIQQPGVVTIIDIEGKEDEDGQDAEENFDPIVAHFVAHSEAVIALKFDASGMLLVTADRRGHDFHVFRINPHPCGPSLASVHHLYILHRGDTTAKVQDIAISSDSRWTAISTLRGTTHVFAISPYGGACGVRTHTQPRVVNRLSRFHRSAGLPIHAHAPKRPSGSPVGDGMAQGAWFPNPRLPPYPLPTTAAPLAQLRPTANLPTHTITRTSSGRQRLSSLSEDSNSAPLLARARFGPAVVGGAGGAGAGGRGPAAPVAALYLVTAGGTLLHLLLHPRPLAGVPKEKICDESPIELQVESVAQWALQRPPAAADLLAPLPPANPLLRHNPAAKCTDICMSEEERWLSQVEIVTHAGPHRRLWMGPQFVFKTYNCTGSNSSLSEAETVEVETSVSRGVARSNPVNMPGVRACVPVLVDSGSASSVEHSPSNSFRRKSLLAESGRAASMCDVQLREDLAEAMKEEHGCPREARAAEGGGGGGGGGEEAGGGVARAVDPLGCVVVSRAAAPPPASPDADLYTRANRDEATFRPVVRAAAALPPAALPLRPLPRTTTIPVQPLPAHRDHHPPTPTAYPLDTCVYIPAALAAQQGTHDNRRPPASLPEQNRPPTDIQPAARFRVDESPTRKSSDDDVSCKISVRSESGEVAPPPADDNSKAVSVNVNDGVAKLDDEVLQVPVLSPALTEESHHVARDDSSAVASKKDDRVSMFSTIETALQSTKKLPKSDKKVREKSISPARPNKNYETLTSTRRSLKSADKPNEKDVSSAPATTESDTIDQKSTLRKVSLTSMKHSSKLDKEIHEKSVSPAPTPTSCSGSNKRDKNSGICKVSLPSNSKRSLKPDAKNDTGRHERSASPDRFQNDSDNKHDTSAMSKMILQSSKRLPKSGKEIHENSISLDSTNTIKDSNKKDHKSDVPTIVLPSLPSDSETQVKIISSDTSFTDCNKIDSKSNKCKTTQPSNLSNTEECENTTMTKSGGSSSSQNDQIGSSKVLSSSRRSSKPIKWQIEDIKTEEQAWDMLMTEPESASLSTSPQSTASDKLEDNKSKTKKIRKVKKTPEEVQAKAEEDSFIEIHAIDEKQQPSSGDLVSISSPFEDVDNCVPFITKTKKSRISKSMTPERLHEPDKSKVDLKPHDDLDPSSKVSKSLSKMEDTFTEIAVQKYTNELFKDKVKFDNISQCEDVYRDSYKESSKTRKGKSLSPYISDYRKSVETLIDTEIKDVYVIDSTKEEFPEIQITRAGSKQRRKSPQPSDTKSQENHVIIEKPVKSWSSIASSKSIKKSDEVDIKDESEYISLKSVSAVSNDRFKNFEDYSVASICRDSKVESSKVSLQEKLYELCKRTDIMVAECDAPSELNFIEEHHSVIHDLPPLEPLDFALDDFKLEVMRDSLLDVNDTKLTSPICKINIDDILSSIKETTSKVIESSNFNLIDLEKLPAKKEKGFSVIEGHKITSQEVKLDDNLKSGEKDIEVMEKSSDDDNTSPVISTDSDKEDKKTGASKLTLPSMKQLAKSKKSRRKKK